MEKLPENELEAISGGKGQLPMQKVHEALHYLPLKLQGAITTKQPRIQKGTIVHAKKLQEKRHEHCF